MIVFWVIAALLIGAALLFVLPPLLQRDYAQGPDHDKLNIDLYKDKLAELDNDRRNGVLSEEQYQQARQDLERDLLYDVSEREQKPGRGDGRMAQWGAVLVVAMTIPLVSVVMYQALGSGGPGLNPERVAEQQPMTREDLDRQLADLEAHLEENPDDLGGWSTLGRTYLALERFEAASKALERANELATQGDPNLLADYAEALAMANDRNLTGQPMELVNRALSIQPFHQKALWLAANGALQMGRPQQSIEYWQRLGELFPEGSEDRQQVQDSIANIRSMMARRQPGGGTAPPAAPGQGGDDAVTNARVTGTVSLAPDLAESAAPDDTVFIFARATNGPRMPLAIERTRVQDLPYEFVLDDTMAMSPGMKLSSFPQVIIGARVSRSGDAMPASGDLQGMSSAVPVGSDQPVEIVIDTKIP